MKRMMEWMTIVTLLVSLLTGCESFWPGSAAPTDTPLATPTATSAPPTSTPTVTPEITTEPTPEATLTLTLTLTLTPEATSEPGKAFVVAQHEGEGMLAMASLTLVQLTPGRQYLVEVSSRAGAVAFTGMYTNWASDANATPALDTQTLAANTPARWAIQPPLAAPTNWTYSISVQTTGGHIRVIIWDVTDAA